MDIIIDTNVLIKMIQKAYEFGQYECVLEILKDLLRNCVLKGHNNSRYIRYMCLMERQIDELVRWIRTNICNKSCNVRRCNDVKEQVKTLFGKARRASAFSRMGVRFIQRSYIEAKRQRLEEHIQGQIENLGDEVDRFIAYLSLSHGLEGKGVKVITADSKLANVIFNKIKEMGIENRVRIKQVEEDMLDKICDLIRDP